MFTLNTLASNFIIIYPNTANIPLAETILAHANHEMQIADDLLLHGQDNKGLVRVRFTSAMLINTLECFPGRAEACQDPRELGWGYL